MRGAVVYVGVAHWLTIDAVLDNVHAIGNVDGDQAVDISNVTAIRISGYLCAAII